MRRVYCDGCFKAGVFTDLTGRKDAWRVPITKAHILDLCPERCAKIYESFDAARKGALMTSKSNFKAHIDELQTWFWKGVEDGSTTKKPTPEFLTTTRICEPSLEGATQGTEATG